MYFFGLRLSSIRNSSQALTLVLCAINAADLQVVLLIRYTYVSIRQQQHKNVPAMCAITVFERDESIRSRLPLDLYGTDEKAALGAWVLLEMNIEPPQLAPVADPNPSRHERVGEAIIPHVRHTDIVP